MTEPEHEEEPEMVEEEVGRLKHDLEEQIMLADDYLSRLKYLQAEFENYKKIVAREQEMYKMRATEELIKNLLPVIDNLEMAIASARRNEDDQTLVEGIELIYANLVAVLAKEGLKPLKTVGEKFDPYEHEVILTVLADDLPEDTIVEELEKGYKLGTKVIRTSKVKISKAVSPGSSQRIAESED
ncbi:MAG: nucleotide exchange factor GrpE [Halobacteriota archaeon]